jgi:HlyD family secretion protein
MKSRWWRRLLILAVLVLIGVLLRYTLLRPKPIPVTVYRVAIGRVEDTVTNSKAGTIKTRHRATLSTEIGGRVLELRVREGDRVRRGEIVMRIAAADYRAQLTLQQRSLEAASADRDQGCQAAELAERDLTRNRQLVKDGILSQQVLDQFQSKRDMAVASCEAGRARVRQAEAAVELARVNLEKTVLRAPFDAVVADVSTEVGEWITPSPPGIPIPAVIDLIDPDAIYVQCPLDEVDVAKVRPGLPARITMDAYPGRSFMGRVVQVAPYVQDVQDQNRTFDVEVEFDDHGFARTLRPGTSADLEVILAARDQVLRIPSYALIESGQVMLVRDHALVARPVKTGLKNWEFTEIVAGLQAGDRIVVSLDRAEVKEGAQVRIESETLK